MTFNDNAQIKGGFVKRRKPSQINIRKKNRFATENDVPGDVRKGGPGGAGSRSRRTLNKITEKLRKK